MTCMVALESMLDAEPDELAGRGSSPLAAHVRDCARCHTVAARLLDDTRAVAALMAPVDHAAWPARRITRAAAVAAGALAATLMFVLWRLPSAPNQVPVAVTSVPPQPTPTPTPSIEPIAPAPGTRGPTPPSVVANRTTGRAVGLTATPPRANDTEQRATPLVAYHAPASEPARAVVVAPVVASRVDPVPVVPDTRSLTESRASDSDMIGVTVDPKLGRRAVVMRTSDPTITVVWLY